MKRWASFTSEVPTSSIIFYVKDGGRWIATGDQALVDIAGAVHVLGRYKDLIIRVGSNISAASIERVLNKANGIVVSTPVTDRSNSLG